MNVTLEFVCVIVRTMIQSSNPSVDGIENVNMNIRKDERCFFERCCDLPCVHSYVVYVSIIVVSLITILILNSNPSVNIRIRLSKREKSCEMFLCVKSLPCVQSYLVRVSLGARQTLSISSISITSLLFFIYHFHSSKEKVEKFWKFIVFINKNCT